MTKVSVRTGDTVLVNSGKDSGKKGKVLAVKRNKDSVRVIVEGANIVTKAKKARTAQEKSELVKIEAAIDVSNVNVICPSCGKAIRVAHAVVNGKKIRVCSKCSASLDAKVIVTKADKKAKASKAETPAAEAETKAEKPAKTAAAKPPAAKTEKKSTAVSKPAAEKATKTASAKKPTTSRSSQRGV